MKEDGLYLTGSDSDITIKTFLKNDKEIFESIEKEGTIVIQGKYILDIIRKLDSEFVNIEVIDGLKTLIWTETSEFNLNGIDPKEYPNIDLEENKSPVVIDIDVFKNIISQTSFAVSKEEVRPLLTGINIKIENNKMECIATDSYRLAKKIVELDKKVENLVNITIPGKNLLELDRVMHEEGNLEIHIFNNKVLFKFNDMLFQTRILNGTYPDTSKLIPEDFAIDFTASRTKFYSVLDRASILINDKDKNIVKLEVKGNDITVSSNSPEIGKVEENMDVQNNKDSKLNISFSSKYMMEALKVFTSDEIELLMNGEVNPIIIREIGNDNVIQLILPIKTY
jgi:DNA polymerase-3 subunit beta